MRLNRTEGEIRANQALYHCVCATIKAAKHLVRKEHQYYHNGEYATPYKGLVLPDFQGFGPWLEKNAKAIKAHLLGLNLQGKGLHYLPPLLASAAFASLHVLDLRGNTIADLTGLANYTFTPTLQSLHVSDDISDNLMAQLGDNTTVYIG